MFIFFLFKPICVYFFSFVRWIQSFIICFEKISKLHQRILIYQKEIFKSKSPDFVLFFTLFPGYVHGVWLGYSDLLQENQFLTISNAEPLNYKHWNSGEPSNTNGREHCVGYSMGTKNWNDCYCTSKLNYVCKK